MQSYHARIVTLALLTLVLALSTGEALAVRPYYIASVDPFTGGTYTAANAISPTGAVTGYGGTSSGQTHPLAWTSGASVDLTTLGGTTSQGTDIDASGKVVGWSGTDASNDYPYRGVIWSGGSKTTIGTFSGSGSSRAYGLNAGGLIVGQATASTGDHAFFYTGGTLTDLNPLLPATTYLSQASAINNATQPQIVGTYRLSSDPSTALAFALQNGVFTDLGNWGGSQTVPLGNNNAGWVVGHAQVGDDSGDYHAFLWRSGTLEDIQPPDVTGQSKAYSVNNSGQVVGFADIGDGGARRAFVWQNGTMYDLNTLLPPGTTWQLSSAVGINDAGQIAGNGLLGTASRAFVLTPALLGDANLDKQVSVGDLGILAGNYGKTSGATWAMADFNGDGAVSVGDLGMLAGNYGATAAAAVPEPATTALLALGVLARRRRRNA